MEFVAVDESLETENSEVTRDNKSSPSRDRTWIYRLGNDYSIH